MADITIYGAAMSTYVRTARMACEEKGVPYELQEVDHLSDEYRKNHPFAKMPAMQHGDFLLYETSAITRYVDEVFEGPPLQPADAKQRARMNQWISAINAYINPTMVGQLVMQRLVAPMRGGTSDEKVIEAAMPEVERQARLIDAALADTGWLAAPSLSLADLFLCPIFFYVAATPEGKKLFESCGNIVKFNGQVHGLASFKATIPQLPK